MCWKCSENVNTIIMMYVVAISNKSQMQNIEFDGQINRNDCDGLSVCVRAWVSERKNDVFAYVFGEMLAKMSTTQHLLRDLRPLFIGRHPEKANDVEHFEI